MISKSFPYPSEKPQPKGIDHGLDLRVGQNLVDTGFFHVQDLSPDREDRLEIPVPGRLGRTAGGISLHDEDFADRGIATLAVSQFSVGIEGIFLPGQHVGLGFLLGFTDLGRFLRAGEDIFQGLKISVKIENQLLVGNFSGGLGRVLVVQFRLGLALETGMPDV